MSRNQQIERIASMEKILDASVDCVGNLQAVLDAYERLLPELKQLEDYYSSKTWLADHDDDSKGLIPKDLSRGVLTEDAVYDLLGDVDALKRQMVRLSIGD